MLRYIINLHEIVKTINKTYQTETIEMRANIDYKKFGNAIRLLRLEQKATQQNICDAIGISGTYYSNIENGLARPSLEVLVLLANYFDIPLSPSLITKERLYRIPFDIKSLFSECTDSVALDVLDIVSYAKMHLYP